MNGSLCKLANAIELERGDRSAYRLGHTFGRNKKWWSKKECLSNTMRQEDPCDGSPLTQNPRELASKQMRTDNALHKNG